ncbi:MAG: PASTA domain-containing protein [Candidatus Margulisiibacteriota bacterium]|jgi:beta-lactam-binding protein with PASTA domain
MFEIVLLAVILFFAGLLIAKMVKNLKLPRSLTVLAIVFIMSPIIIGYLFLSYFNSMPEGAVPDVMGLPFEEARIKLEDAGLKVRVAGNVYDPEISEGSVAYQKPEAGRNVKTGRVINVKICSKEKVFVPNVINKSISATQGEITGLNLIVGEVKYEKNHNLVEGTVLAQEPMPGEEVSVETKIDLLVSTTLEVIQKTEGSEEVK